MGNILYAHYSSGYGVDYAWDALGRKTSETSSGSGYSRTVSSQYDLAGNRTRLTYPDSNYIQYTYDVLSRVQQVQQNGSTLMVQYAYDSLGRISTINRNNSATIGKTTNTYNSTSQNWSLDQSGLSQNVTYSMTYTPAAQIDQRTVSNSAYAYSVSALSQSYSANGLNQYATATGTNYSYDGRGNLTCVSTGASCTGTVSKSYSYDLENRLVGESTSSTTIGYDPVGRMQQTTVSSATEQYLYDGNDLVVEYDGSGNILRRYVPGPGTDHPLVWYQGSGVSSPNWLHTDQQGSIIAASNSAGTATTFAYGPGGEPSGGWGSSPATPIFRYTGQAALPSAKLYYYKARMYDPALGRFLQTDPGGYSAGLNLYAYVGNDPINATDPSGMAQSADNCPRVGDADDPFVCPESVTSTADRLAVNGGPSSALRGSRGPDLNDPGPTVTSDKTPLNKLWACTKAQYGFDGDGATPGLPGIGDLLGDAFDPGLFGDALRAGSEIGALPVPKSLVGVPNVSGDASRFTNLLNYGSLRLGMNTRIPQGRVRAFFRFTRSARIATIVGRANVVVGAGLATYDATSIAICVAN